MEFISFKVETNNIKKITKQNKTTKKKKLNNSYKFWKVWNRKLALPWLVIDKNVNKLYSIFIFIDSGYNRKEMY